MIKKVGTNSRYFVGVFNKPLALVGYEIIIANYPTRTLGIIVTNIIGDKLLLNFGAKFQR